MQVLTLVADALTPEIVETARRAVGGRAPDWLGPGRAADIPFEGADLRDAEARARTALGGAPVDLSAQNATGRRKKLLIADMDSTVITIECIDELADIGGLKDKIAAITARAMRGELDFAAALKERIAMMAGLPESALRRVYDERLDFTPGARALVRTMRESGAFTALVSGGFTYFTERVRAEIGFDVDHANRLVFADGRLKGVEEPILGASAKLDWLHRFVGERRIGLAETLAVGDGANDIPMLEAAGLGVAFHAKPKTAAAASARVDHGDLTTLLYYQGYRREEFAA